MFLKLKNLFNKYTISKNDILNIIKETARTMTLYDEMIASGYLREKNNSYKNHIEKNILKLQSTTF